MPKVDPLLEPPVLFAHSDRTGRGAVELAESHCLALRLGATGLYSSLELDQGQLLLGRATRRRRSAGRVTLSELYTSLAGKGVQLALEITRFDAATGVLDEARRRTEIERLWLCSADLDLLVALREHTAAARLVHVCVPTALAGGAERHAAHLRAARVDGVAVPEDRVAAGLVALMHRFSRLVIASGADYVRTATRGLDNGADAVMGADPEALAEAASDRPPSRSS